MVARPAELASQAPMGARNATSINLALLVSLHEPQPLQPLTGARNLRIRLSPDFSYARALQRCEQFKRLAMDAVRKPRLAAKGSPPAIILVHPDASDSDQHPVAPAGKAQKPGGMRAVISNAPLCEFRRRQVVIGNHADRSFVSTCGTMPSTVAGPAVGIEMQTRASLSVAPSNGRF